jgi:hypothetical protein
LKTESCIRKRKSDKLFFVVFLISFALKACQNNTKLEAKFRKIEIKSVRVFSKSLPFYGKYFKPAGWNIDFLLLHGILLRITFIFFLTFSIVWE